MGKREFKNNHSKNGIEYLITAAEYGARPNHKQLDTYEQYAKENKAEIIVIPIEGQWRGQSLHERFKNYNLVNDYTLCKELEIKDFGIKSQNINPLTGLRRFSSVNKSMIVASPKQHLEFVANSASYDPKAIMSTGVCTLPNYKEQHRIGKIGKEDHKQGAILVDLEDNGYFHFRQIENNSNGTFTSLGRRYNPKGKSKFVGSDTLVVGDLHTYQMDMDAYNTTLDMIQYLKPKNIVLHDVFDGTSITHHDIGKLITRGRKSGIGATSLRDELVDLGNTLNQLYNVSDDANIYIVKSNHDETLNKYLENVRFVGDSQNLELSIRLATGMLDGRDPLQYGLNLVDSGLPSKIKFLQRDSELKRYGWHLSSHGDKGSSGTRGSIVNFEYTLGKAIVGHFHQPKIRKDIRSVGTLERMDVDYTKGSTGAWSATNAVIYKGGKSELLNIFEGKYML